VPTYHVENFGCRATQADGAALERQFASRGLNAASSAEADVVVFNTCTVTNSADQDARAAIRRVRRQNPQAKIVVTGCYAQRAPQEIAALPGVTCVVGNSHKHQLAEIVLPVFPQPIFPHSGGYDFSGAERSARESAVAAGVNTLDNPTGFFPLSALTDSRDAQTDNRQLATGNRVFVSDIFAHTELLAAPVFEAGAASGRTRPTLKVQDGCNNRCSFCVIPSVRGHSRSLPLAQVIAEVNSLVAAGYRELALSGINLGRWGRDLTITEPWGGNATEEDGSSQRPTTNDQRLVTLIGTILAKTQLEKLRISSVEPMDWTGDLIALVASSPRIAKHAHVPLQSGSDAVLRRMHRKYRPWHYREKIEKIRAAMPSAAIGADVMVGFPGETDAEFDATRRLIEDLPFTYLHVFTYSARPGTPAAAMRNQVPVHIARQRNKILRDLASEKKSAFMHSFIGKELEAITLNITHDGPGGEFTEALTDNYLKLYVRGTFAPNQWVTAGVESVDVDALVGASTQTVRFQA